MADDGAREFKERYAKGVQIELGNIERVNNYVKLEVDRKQRNIEQEHVKKAIVDVKNSETIFLQKR